MLYSTDLVCVDAYGVGKYADIAVKVPQPTIIPWPQSFLLPL